MADNMQLFSITSKDVVHQRGFTLLKWSPGSSSHSGRHNLANISREALLSGFLLSNMAASKKINKKKTYNPLSFSIISIFTEYKQLCFIL